MKNTILIILILFLAGVFSSCDPAKRAQRNLNKNTSPVDITKTPTPAENYINTYKNMAVREMNRSGIPASITLAQGILESGNGLSSLAVKGNNHFGIKCGKNWVGGAMYLDDDAEDECFRTYNNADESYRDHSDFLMQNSRYATLFQLDKTDYKAWAYGLKQAGYATRVNYADVLIDIIEKNRLYELDKGGDFPDIGAEINTLTSSVNGIPVIIAKKGDTWQGIASSTGIELQKLLKYNEAGRFDTIPEGSYIFLRQKKNKAKESYHIFRLGETVHSVSQLYGIKADRIYRMNNIPKGRIPAVGEILFLHQQRTGEAKTISEKEYQLLLVQNTVQLKKTPDTLKTGEKPVLKSDTLTVQKVTEEEPATEEPWANDKKIPDNEEIVTPQPPPANTDVLFHIVLKGETLYGIARKYNTTPSELTRINHLTGTSVRVGDTLYLKEHTETGQKTTAPQNVSETRNYDTTWHVVKTGEDLYAISNQYQVSIIDLININKLEVYDLDPGKKLIVQIYDKNTGKNLLKPSTSQQQTVPVQKKQANTQETVTKTGQNEEVRENTETHIDSPDEKYHIVKPGETLYRISVNHKKTVDQLKKLNNLTDNNIKVGQKLIINP